MPIDTPMIDDEEEVPAFDYAGPEQGGQELVVEPGSPSLPSASPPPPDLNPAHGPAGFSSFNAYLNARDDAARGLLAKQAEDAQMQAMLQQSAGVESQMRAIQSYRRFMATRRLGDALRQGVAAGLPPEQALAHAAIGNLDAFSNPASAAGIFTAAAKSRVQAPQLGGGTALIDPRTGKPVGVGFRTSQGGMTAHFDPSGALPGGANVAALLGEIRMLQQQRVLAADDPDTTKAPAIDSQIASAMQELRALRREGAPSPVAPPAGSGSAAASFPTEDAARAAGHKAGSVIYLQGVGKVRLK